MSTQSQVGIEVQELAECGEYQSVEIVHALDSGCGGVLQLRQVRRKLMMMKDSGADASIRHQEVRTESSSIRLDISKKFYFSFPGQSFKSKV